jgi:hypothetical protein
VHRIGCVYSLGDETYRVVGSTSDDLVFPGDGRDAQRKVSRVVYKHCTSATVLRFLHKKKVFVPVFGKSTVPWRKCNVYYCSYLIMMMLMMEELLMTDELLATAIRTLGPTLFLQMVCKNTKDT